MPSRGDDHAGRAHVTAGGIRHVRDLFNRTESTPVPLAWEAPERVAQAIVLRQLLNVAKAVHDMHKVSSDLRRARHICDLVKHQLSQVAAALRSVSASVAAVDNEAAEAECTGTVAKPRGAPPAR